MAVQLVTKFQGLVDERFSAVGIKGLISNNDYSFDGAHTINVYSATTATMNDYNKTGVSSNPSRYGSLEALSATTTSYTLEKDRSFTTVTDKLDIEESMQVLEAGKILSRQINEVVDPEIDTFVIGKMVAGAGTKAMAKALDGATVMEDIFKANEALDSNNVPQDGRFILVTPTTYKYMKSSKDIILETNVGQDMRVRGVIATVDGLSVIKVPANRCPVKFGFLVGHKVATVAPIKLNDMKVHIDPVGISGQLCEGRFNYGAFVLPNKAKALYYQPLA